MTRHVLAAGFSLAMALQPTVPAVETDLPRYALTQGGLLIVVFVLLWSIRNDVLRTSKEKDDALAVMTKMVTEATIAQTKTADAVDRMARAIETLQNVQLREPSRKTD